MGLLRTAALIGGGVYIGKHLKDKKSQSDDSSNRDQSSTDRQQFQPNYSNQPRQQYSGNQTQAQNYQPQSYNHVDYSPPQAYNNRVYSDERSRNLSVNDAAYSQRRSGSQPRQIQDERHNESPPPWSRRSSEDAFEEQAKRGEVSK